MIYVLTGTNDYLRLQRKQELITEFTKKYGDFAIEKLDCEEVAYDKIKEAIESLPFLAERKLVILLTPSKNKEFSDRAKSLLSDLPDTTDVIIDEPKFDKRSGYYKYASKLEGFENFEPLDAPALRRWAGEYVKKQGSVIEPSAIHELFERVGNDQLRLSSELNKLSLYSEKIDHDTVQKLTAKTPSSTIFELIDAAFSGNKQRAIELYDEQRMLQVEPIQIIAMFTWQFHVLALVKSAGNKSSAEIAREAKLNPYVVQKTTKIADKLSFQDIKKSIHKLQQLDEKMKSSKINIDDALRSFILAI